MLNVETLFVLVVSAKKKILDVVTGEKYSGWMANRHHGAGCSRITWDHIYVSLLHLPAISTFCKWTEGSAGLQGDHTEPWCHSTWEMAVGTYKVALHLEPHSVGAMVHSTQQELIYPHRS